MQRSGGTQRSAYGSKFRESGKILEYHRINAMRLYLKMFINNAAYLAGGIPNLIATIVISWSESMELASPNILVIVQYD